VIKIVDQSHFVQFSRCLITNRHDGDTGRIAQTVARITNVYAFVVPGWRDVKVARVDLTHVDASGAARMVDVSDKAVSARVAVATGVLRTTQEVLALLRRDGLPKGDALATARIAGIMGAKRTPDLIPLCHPIALSGVTLDLQLPDGGEPEIRITATVRTTERTGVEMEALTAVAVAGLTLHDMIKAVDPAAVLDRVRVERKDGGKTGSWIRPCAPGDGA
jgi:cyclic pyranopterin phosphate synthase